MFLKRHSQHKATTTLVNKRHCQVSNGTLLVVAKQKLTTPGSERVSDNEPARGLLLQRERQWFGSCHEIACT